MGLEAGDFLDSICLATAPLLRDVVSLPGVLVGDRQHSGQDSALLAGQDSALLADPARFAREAERTRVRCAFARRAAGIAPPGGAVEEAPLRRRELLQFRSAAARLAPHLPGLPSDSPARLALVAMC